MRALLLILVLIFLSACTTTTIIKYDSDGKPLFKASNTSVGWDREDVSLGLLKTKDQTLLKVGIGKSGGSRGLEGAINGMQEALDTLKALRP